MSLRSRLSRYFVNQTLGVGARALKAGRVETAVSKYERAVRLATGQRDLELRAHDAAAEALIQLDRGRQGADHLRAMLRLDEGDAKTWRRLAKLLNNLGENGEAADAWRQVIKIRGDDLPAHQKLAGWLFEQGRFAEAAPHLRAAAEAAPDNVKAWRRLATASRESGDGEGALRAWSRVLQLVPGEVRAHGECAEVLDELGRKPETVKHLRALAEASPQHASLWRQLAQRLAEVGEDTAAVEAWRRVVQIKPSDSDAHANLVSLLDALGRKAESVEHLRWLAEAAPDKAKPWTRLARCLEEVGDAAAAVDAWTRVLQLNETDVKAREHLVGLLDALGRQARAVEHLRWLAEAAPDKTKPWARLARRLEEVGDAAAAVDAWTRVLQLNETDVKAREHLVGLLDGQGRKAESVEHLRWLADAAPDKVELARRFARRLQEVGEDEDGLIEAWRRVLKANGSDREALEALASLMSRLDRAADALPYLRALAKASPGRTKELKRLARSLKMLNRDSEELETWKRVLAIDPAEMEAHHRLADLLSRSGQLALAIPHFTAIASADPGDPKSWKRLAQLYEKIEDSTGAVRAWRRVLEVAPGDPTSHGRLAELLCELDQPAKAIPHFRVLTKAFPDRVKTWKGLALSLEQTGDAKRAAANWRQALKVRPADSQAHDHLVQLSELAGRKDLALQHLFALTEIEPTKAKRWIDLGRMAEELEDFDTAAQAWTRAIELQDTDEVRGDLGLVLYRMGRLEQALPYLRAYVAAKPEDVKSWRRLARCLRDLADVNGAAWAWRQVLTIAGEDEEARQELVVARTHESDTFVEAQTSYALSLMAFWGRLGKTEPEEPEIAKRVFSDVLNCLNQLVEGVKMNNPSGIGQRHEAITSICRDPRFTELADRFPAMVAKFFEVIGQAKADRSVLMEGVASTLGRRPSQQPRLPEILRAQISGGKNLKDVERLLDSPQFQAPILICGFHHSGTRLLARLLETVGVFQEVNMPTHEWTYIQWLNTIMLPGWADLEAINQFTGGEAAGTIWLENLAPRLAAAGYDGKGPWGHKDPRNCVTALAWLQAFPKLRIVNVVRTPVDTLGTLPARYTRFSPDGARPQDALEFWIELWTAYLVKTRQAMAKASHEFEVNFDDLCRDPDAQVRRIIDALALDVDPPAIDAFEGIAIDTSKIGDHRRWLKDGDLTKAQVDRLKGLANDFGFS